MPFNLGPLELIIILVIVAMLFGVGKLPEVFGAVGKGIREFRKEAQGDEKNGSSSVAASAATTGTAAPTNAAATSVPAAAANVSAPSETQPNA
jgi:sec-independent protein translocase protein TatA